MHGTDAFYCTLSGLADRSDVKTNRPRLRAAEGVHKWIVCAYYHNVRRVWEARCRALGGTS